MGDPSESTEVSLDCVCYYNMLLYITGILIVQAVTGLRGIEMDSPSRVCCYRRSWVAPYVFDDTLADAAFLSSCTKAGIQKGKSLGEPKEPSRNSELPLEIVLPGQSVISSELMKSSLAKVASNPTYTLGQVALT